MTLLESENLSDVVLLAKTITTLCLQQSKLLSMTNVYFNQEESEMVSLIREFNIWSTAYSLLFAYCKGGASWMRH